MRFVFAGGEKLGVARRRLQLRLSILLLTEDEPIADFVQVEAVVENGIELGREGIRVERRVARAISLELGTCSPDHVAHGNRAQPERRDDVLQVRHIFRRVVDRFGHSIPVATRLVAECTVLWVIDEVSAAGRCRSPHRQFESLRR